MRTTSLCQIVAVLSFATIAGCSSHAGDPARQYGADPYLPEPHEYLLPPMSVPKAIGWNGAAMSSTGKDLPRRSTG